MPYKGKAKNRAYEQRRRSALREYQREWVRKRRDAYLAGKSCARCGSTNELQVDHIDPATKDSSLRRSGGGALWSMSAKRLAAELAKCQVLCIDCHRVKTARENTLDGRKHGERQTYNKGCRCADCRSANATYRRRQRATRKPQAR